MPNEPVVYTISSPRIQENIFPDFQFIQQNTAFAVKIDSLSKVVKSYFLKPGCICQPGFVVCSSVS